MSNEVIIFAEIVSTALCFVLVRFMTKPYQYTGENRYISLPVGFALLGISYIFMGLALSFDNPLIVEEMKWLQLFTQAYAFAFLAVTYYLSKKAFKQNIRLRLQIVFSFMIVGVIVSCLIVFAPPIFSLPSYKTVDEYFRGFNIIFAVYLSFHTLKSHATNPDPKTVWAPLGYVSLGFSQYSFLIWSIDSSFPAFVGAHILRLVGLLIFLFISYAAFSTSHSANVK